MIGNKIAEARKRISLSQTQLAERLFISPQAVGKWERGESMPDILTFNRLAKVLGVDLNYFSDGFPSTVEERASVDQQPLPSDFAVKERLPWDMSRGNWVDADFSGLKDLHDKFSSSNMQRCRFIGSDLSGLLLKGNNVDSCDFSGSAISKSNIQSSNLLNNSFRDCSLQGTEFFRSFVTGCDFSGADLTGTAFRSGGFQNNPLPGTILNRTSFTDTAILDTVFQGSMENCYFENCSFRKVVFQQVTVRNTFFKCRSLKKILFVDCLADQLTYAFLKNGGANLAGITLLNG